MSLQEKTLILYRARPRSKTHVYVAKATGIPFSWLRYFSSGKMKNPRAEYVLELYKYLTGKPLDY